MHEFVRGDEAKLVDDTSRFQYSIGDAIVPVLWRRFTRGPFNTPLEMRLAEIWDLAKKTICTLSILHWRCRCGYVSDSEALRAIIFQYSIGDAVTLRNPVRGQEVQVRPEDFQYSIGDAHRRG